MHLDRQEKPLNFFLVLRHQFSSPEHRGCRGGSGEAIETFGEVQDRFSRAGIGNCPATSRACSARSSHSNASLNIDGMLVLPPAIVSRLHLSASLSGHVSPRARAPKTAVNHLTQAIAANEPQKVTLRVEPRTHKLSGRAGSDRGEIAPAPVLRCPVVTEGKRGRA